MEKTTESPRSRLSSILAVLAWGTTLALTAVLVCRAFWFDATHLFIWLNAFTLYVFLPAYACLIWAIAVRRWRLASWSAAIVTAHLFLIVPANFAPSQTSDSITASSAQAKDLRVFFANVRSRNNEYEALFDEIEKVDPDLVVLVEFSRRWHQVTDNAPIMEKFPYRPKMPYSSPGVYSKFPITGEKFSWLPHKLVLSFDLSLEDQFVRVVCVHGPRPLSGPFLDYFSYWQQLLPLLAAQPNPCIMVGDFNATQFSKAIQDLAAAGWHSAHEWTGRGYATTWPNGTILVPPIRIDHAFFRGAIQCLAITEGIGKGSDHRPLVADFRVVSTEPAPAE
jgi:endonuclease/exonuclease/phosphatase (EEP) superfamily protein YafD